MVSVFRSQNLNLEKFGEAKVETISPVPNEEILVLPGKARQPIGTR